MGLGVEKLSDVVEFLLTCDLEERHVNKLMNEQIVKEKSQCTDRGYYFVYDLYFQESDSLVEATFDKESYYDWLKMKDRKIKLEKITNKK